MNNGKTLFAVSGLMFGGGQKVVQNLLQEGKKHNYDVTVLLLGKNEEEFYWTDALSVEYDGRYNHIGTLMSTAWRLRCAIGNERPRLIHTHGWDADMIGYLARRGSNVKQLVHLHVTPEWLSSRKFKQVVRRFLTRRMLLSSDTRVIAVSNAVREHWEQHLGLRHDGISVVHNGVDTAVYKPVDRDKGSGEVPVIGVAARLAPMKGISYLIQALIMLKEQGVRFDAKIAGEGGLRKQLEADVAEGGLENDVTFLKRVDDMARFYSDVDVFVLPSMSEGMPLSVLEAMASGVPVVATKVGGTPEAVRDGIDGFLVTPGSTSELAQKLKMLITDLDLRQRLGESARRRAVEVFSLDRFSREVFALYQ